jgi:hypothetical protein
VLKSNGHNEWSKELFGPRFVQHSEMAWHADPATSLQRALGPWLEGIASQTIPVPPSETRLGMLTALADLGEVLGPRGEQTPAEMAVRVRDGLAQRSGWLLIFDNAPDPAAAAEFLPVAGGGHVLVTSRDPAWHGIAEPVAVDLLTSDEAVQLLVGRSGDGDRQAAERLAMQLTGCRWRWSKPAPTSPSNT